MGGNERSLAETGAATGRLYQVLVLSGLGLFILALVLSGILGGAGFIPGFLDDSESQTPTGELINGTTDDAEMADQNTAGTIEITDLSAPERVTAGDSFEIQYTIENTGETPIEETLTLSFGGSVIAEVPVDLDSGESNTVNHDIETEEVDPGEYDLELTGAGLSEHRSITVESEGDDATSNFVISELSVTETATAGDEITVEYTIENTGDREGSTSIVLEFDGEPIREGSVSLSPGESATGSETIETDDMASDDYPVDLLIDGDDDRAWVTLESAGDPAFSVTSFDVPGEASTDDEFTVEYTIENTGDASGSTSVALAFDGDIVSEETVSADPGESVTNTVTIETHDLDEGYHPVEVDTDDGLVREWIELVDDGEPDFAIDDLDAPDEATVGDEVEVVVTIENDGDAEGTARWELSFDNEVISSDEVTLGPDESMEVEVVIDTEGYDEGEYPIDVTVGDDADQEWIELESEEDDDDDGGIFSARFL